MVQELAVQGITDQRVLTAMDTVPRHRFVQASDRRRAYANIALPLMNGATISQPYIVALMAQSLSLDGSERVLEVGTGSGYGAAILTQLAETVISIEVDPELVVIARRNLAAVCGDRRPEVIEGDGSSGFARRGPYDAISVTAAAPAVPPPLVNQLSLGGRMIIPIDDRRRGETLTLVSSTPSGLATEAVASVRFVPLRGEHGYPSRNPSGL